MATYKYIWWRNDIPKKDGKRFANVHMLVGYNQGTITDFQDMAQELRKSFPAASDKDVRCGHVTKSTYVNGFSVIALDSYIDEGAYEGWTQNDKERGQEYYWQ